MFTENELKMIQFKLGEALEQHGHEVQYFGMDHKGRCVGNRVNAYTSDMDFHGSGGLLFLPGFRWNAGQGADALRIVSVRDNKNGRI